MNWVVAGRLPRVSTPSTRSRVVCGLLEVIDTRSPTNALSKVDLPTLVRPMMATMPVCATGAPASCMASGNRLVARLGTVGRSRLLLGRRRRRLARRVLRFACGLALGAAQRLHGRLRALECEFRGRLLGGAATPARATHTGLELRDAALHLELLVVGGTARFDDGVDRKRQPFTLQILLQQCLAVLAECL